METELEMTIPFSIIEYHKYNKEASENFKKKRMLWVQFRTIKFKKKCFKRRAKIIFYSVKAVVKRLKLPLRDAFNRKICRIIARYLKKPISVF